jgi:hypothetical protein
MDMMGMYIQRIGALLCCALFVSVTAIAQGSADKPASSKTGSQANDAKSAQADTLSGKFEGIARSASIGDMALTLELQNQAGKVSGKLESPHGVGTIKEGTYDAGRVSIKFDFAGDEGVITGQLKGDAITGDWSVGGVGGTLELKRVATAAKASTAPVAAAATVDNISGEWDATADANGEPFPFSLKLKLDGDKVTGESSSSLGGATIKGSWVNGILKLTLDGQGGSTLLTGSLKDGKLVGDFDYAGQLQGKWGASKK